MNDEVLFERDGLLGNVAQYEQEIFDLSKDIEAAKYLLAQAKDELQEFDQSMEDLG